VNAVASAHGLTVSASSDRSLKVWRAGAAVAAPEDAAVTIE